MIKEGHGHYLKFIKGSHGGLSLLTVNKRIFKFYQKIKIRKMKNSCWEYFLNFELSFIRTIFTSGRGISVVLNNNINFDMCITRMEGVEFLTVEKFFKLIFNEFEYQTQKPIMNLNLIVFIKSSNVIFDKCCQVYDILFGLEVIKGLGKNNKELKKKNSKFYKHNEL